MSRERRRRRRGTSRRVAAKLSPSTLDLLQHLNPDFLLQNERREFTKSATQPSEHTLNPSRPPCRRRPPPAHSLLHLLRLRSGILTAYASPTTLRAPSSTAPARAQADGGSQALSSLCDTSRADQGSVESIRLLDVLYLPLPRHGPIIVRCFAWEWREGADAAFSRRLATVVLSLLSDCPTPMFYFLEIIVNTAMITEVSIRLLAFGKVRSRPSSPSPTSDPTPPRAELTSLPPLPAILEVVLQHPRLDNHAVLRSDAHRHLLLGVFRKGGRGF